MINLKKKLNRKSGCPPLPPSSPRTKCEIYSNFARMVLFKNLFVVNRSQKKKLEKNSTASMIFTKLDLISGKVKIPIIKIPKPILVILFLVKGMYFQKACTTLSKTLFGHSYQIKISTKNVSAWVLLRKFFFLNSKNF